ncbi:MAG: hypothetical protein ABIW34_01635 [Ginsengibacter sp.]
MKIGIACYPIYGGRGVLATELGKALADKGHNIHFITYQQPLRLSGFHANIFYHEVRLLHIRCLVILLTKLHWQALWWM